MPKVTTKPNKKKPPTNKKVGKKVARKGKSPMQIRKEMRAKFLAET